MKQKEKAPGQSKQNKTKPAFEKETNARKAETAPAKFTQKGALLLAGKLANACYLIEKIRTCALSACVQDICTARDDYNEYMIAWTQHKAAMREPHKRRTKGVPSTK